jgi:hypothetical protein
VEPALKERRAETKTNRQIMNAIIGNEISKQRQLNQDNPRIGTAGAELIERQYQQFLKENPNVTGDEALGFYRERSALKTLDVAWGRDKKVSGAEVRDMESRGYEWSSKYGRWIDMSAPEEGIRQ